MQGVGGRQSPMANERGRCLSHHYCPNANARSTYVTLHRYRA